MIDSHSVHQESLNYDQYFGSHVHEMHGCQKMLKSGQIINYHKIIQIWDYLKLFDQFNLDEQAKCTMQFL